MRDSLRHRSILAGGIATGLLLTAAANARALVDPVNKDRAGLALKGYDPVAYFKHDKPVKGSAQITHTWIGATWRIASGENRDAFAANPAQYSPQFGGYCSWAVSQGYTADIDPEAWKIVDGRLYLNYSKDVQRKWEQDIPKRIQEANKNWPKLHKLR